ncbi:MAG TPA: acyloxyacyl hydrolase [Roseateles sp.]|nr:acyloxyacyl hydrolase [Roseateles sp.]
MLIVKTRFCPPRCLVLTLLLVVALPGRGEAPAPWRPQTVFAELGVAERAQSVTGGLVWDWGWQRELGWGHVSGHWGVSLGRWHSEGSRGGSAWLLDLGVTPVLRLRSSSWSPGWFVEAGIGAHLHSNAYRNRDKQFSTRFNFGDHLAVGHEWGADRQHELALRLQHFSNAGIKQPNPGENFLQLRYSRRI